MRLTSIAITAPTTANAHHAGSTVLLDRAREPRDRETGDDDADEREDGRLGERREVLRLAVPVLVPASAGPAGDADREERQQRRDEVGAGVERLGDEAEAAAREARRRA